MARLGDVVVQSISDPYAKVMSAATSRAICMVSQDWDRMLAKIRVAGTFVTCPPATSWALK